MSLIYDSYGTKIWEYEPDLTRHKWLERKRCNTRRRNLAGLEIVRVKCYSDPSVPCFKLDNYFCACLLTFVGGGGVRWDFLHVFFLHFNVLNFLIIFVLLRFFVTLSHFSVLPFSNTLSFYSQHYKLSPGKASCRNPVVKPSPCPAVMDTYLPQVHGTETRMSIFGDSKNHIYLLTGHIKHEFSVIVISIYLYLSVYLSKCLWLIRNCRIWN